MTVKNNSLILAKANEAAARQAFYAQLDFAKDRLQFSRIKSEAVGTTEFYANNFKDMAVHTVRANPVAFGSAFIATLAAIFHRSLKHYGPQAVADTAHQLGHLISNMTNFVAQCVDAIGEKFNPPSKRKIFMSSIEQNINETKDTAIGKAENFSASARDAAEAAKDRIVSAYGNAKETAQDAIDAGREKATELYQRGAEKAGETYEASREQLGKAAEVTKETIDNKPMIAVAGALALGMFAGLMAGMSSKRN